MKGWQVDQLENAIGYERLVQSLGPVPGDLG